MTTRRANSNKKSGKSKHPKSNEVIRKKKSRPNFLVALGASAGGLEPIEAFFDNMAEDSGMAFVLIQHLSPDYKSLMDELLSRRTRMPIHRVKDGMPIEANSIYLIPPKKEMAIADGKLTLTEQDRSGNLILPIDIFFRSMAATFKERSIAIVLSGTGRDGARGIVEVHENGGLTIAQDPISAKFDGMPNCAIASGIIDWVLFTEEMPQALEHYIKNLGASRTLPDFLGKGIEDETGVNLILRLLRNKYKIDFTKYKATTVTRRIQRRMMLKQKIDVEEYAKCLEENKEELTNLYKDLLIGVTRFFRDPDAFEVFEKEAIPALFSNKGLNDPVRLWIAGCATGEEAYSIAILLHEYVQKTGATNEIKIFATDVHRSSIEFASAGFYPTESLAAVSPQRIERYFIQEGHHFRIKKVLRQLILFSPHDLIRNPPFTKIDAISCRNLLIYLDPLAQKKILTLFHFSLNVHGILFLGASESTGDLSREFETVDFRGKLFRKRRDIRVTNTPDMLSVSNPSSFGTKNGTATRNISPTRLLRVYDCLLNEFIPSGYLINENHELIHTFGEGTNYLHQPIGRISNDLTERILPELKIPLKKALQHGAKTQSPICYSTLGLELNGSQMSLKLSVRPLTQFADVSAVWWFIQIELLKEETSETLKDVAIDNINMSELSEQRISSLEGELRHAKEDLQSTIEELETSNEELQATNEELVASNEELQSTNEELHSVNEELYTVNTEYQDKIAELTEITNDLENLMACTEIGTVFLDRQMCIRKFTPAIRHSIQLRSQDIGRPITEMAHSIKHGRFIEDLQKVLDSGKKIEVKVEDKNGGQYLMRVLPYLKETGSIDGIVITLVDIVSAIEKMEAALQESEKRFGNLADVAPVLIWICNASGGCTYFNKGWLRFSGRTLEKEKGSGWMELVHPNDLLMLRKEFRQAVEERKPFSQKYRLKRYDGVYRWIHAKGVPNFASDGSFLGFVGANLDIHEQHEAELRFRLAIEASPNSMIMVDASTNIVMVNGQTEIDFGYSASELLGKKIEILIPKRFRGHHATYQQRYINDAAKKVHRMGRGVLYALRKDGIEFPCEIDLVTIHSNQGLFVLSSITNISARLEVEKRLRESEERFERAVAGSNDGLWDWDINTDDVWYSEKFKKMLGYAEDEFSNVQSWKSYLHSEDKKFVLKSLHNHLTNQEKFDVECRLKTKVKGYLWFRVRGRATRDEKENPIKISGSIQDITPIVNARKKLEAYAKELEKRNQELDDFAHIASHDLKAPLRGIHNHSRFLIDDYKDRLDKDGLSRLGRLQFLSRRMEKLISELQKYSKIGRSEAAFEMTDLNRVLKDIHDSTDTVLDKVRLNISESLPTVFTDRVRVTQLFQNLLVNAAKYNDKAKKYIEVGVSNQKKNERVFFVKDNGCGIPEEFRDEIFTIFRRFHDPEKFGEGTGAGLAIVKKIIDYLGGDIWLESEIDKGTTFYFTLNDEECII